MSVAKLEALLGRVQQNRSDARPARPASPATSSEAPREARSSEEPRARRHRTSTPLEMVIETASRAGDEDVTTPGTRRAPAGPPIDDLDKAKSRAPSQPAMKATPAAAPQATPAAAPQATPAAAPQAKPAAAKPTTAEAVQAASIAPPSAPIAAAAVGGQIDTTPATFGALLSRTLRLRPQ